MNKTLLRVAVSGLLFGLASAAHAQARVDVPHVFQAGQPARAADVNANFAALKSALNSMQLPATLAWKGPWQTGVAYLKNDLVEFGGSAYVCIADTAGASTPIDPTKWQLFAAKGTSGATGAPGPRVRPVLRVLSVRRVRKVLRVRKGYRVGRVRRGLRVCRVRRAILVRPVPRVRSVPLVRSVLRVRKERRAHKDCRDGRGRRAT